MDDPMTGRLADILLVEDSPTDIMLTREALEYHEIANPLRVVEDGEAAMRYLRRTEPYASARQPSLIILDLNLPKKSGREVLKEIKSDPRLKNIPVVILTTSKAEEDIEKAYGHNANCYITKPLDLHKFSDVVRKINEFWLGVVTLPGVKL